MEEEEFYSCIRPVHVFDVGRCFYCGCEAEFKDYAPPLKYAEFYLKTAENCSLAIIPCCKECCEYLQSCREGLIEERKEYINRKIEKKYKKALNIYEKWDEDEAQESGQFVRSVTAGIKLGEEAYKRLRYPGFEYEMDGTIYHKRRLNIQEYSVFGEYFDNFRNALQYASRSYKVNINTLKELLMDHNGSFDNAINAYFAEIEAEKILNEKKKLCREFAKKHKQNVNFVLGALDAYERANPELTLHECLDLLYEERVKKTTLIS